MEIHVIAQKLGIPPEIIILKAFEDELEIQDVINLVAHIKYLENKYENPIQEVEGVPRSDLRGDHSDN
jgi:hypothetical protein